MKIIVTDLLKSPNEELLVVDYPFFVENLRFHQPVNPRVIENSNLNPHCV